MVERWGDRFLRRIFTDGERAVRHEPRQLGAPPGSALRRQGGHPQGARRPAGPVVARDGGGRRRPRAADAGPARSRPGRGAAGSAWSACTSASPTRPRSPRPWSWPRRSDDALRGHLGRDARDRRRDDRGDRPARRGADGERGARGGGRGARGAGPRPGRPGRGRRRVRRGQQRRRRLRGRAGAARAGRAGAGCTWPRRARRCAATRSSTSPPTSGPAARSRRSRPRPSWPSTPPPSSAPPVVVDALFGTGLARPIEGHLRRGHRAPSTARAARSSRSTCRAGCRPTPARSLGDRRCRAPHRDDGVPEGRAWRSRRGWRAAGRVDGGRDRHPGRRWRRPTGSRLARLEAADAIGALPPRGRARSQEPARPRAGRRGQPGQARRGTAGLDGGAARRGGAGHPGVGRARTRPRRIRS